MILFGISNRGVIVTNDPMSDKLPLWRTREAAQEVVEARFHRSGYRYVVVEFEVKDRCRTPTRKPR